ncbi:MAG: hypothetical protein RLZ98_3248 [Pseudomonadota bacterium]|jgi:uncharacterized protein YkwD
MYRVGVLLLTASLIAGCSLGSQQLGFGYSGEPNYGSPSNSYRDISSHSPPALALGGEPGQKGASKKRPTGQEVAAFDDRAPSGSFERAPSGSLSDRDYSQTNLVAEEARRLINAYRREHGLKQLNLNVRLTEAARNHSRDLAKWDRISHYGSDGSNPWDRVKRTGYPARVAAENVGTGQSSFKEVLQGWKDSPGHNKNLLLKEAEHMGIALIKDPKTEFKTFWTLVLGSPS